MCLPQSFLSPPASHLVVMHKISLTLRNVTNEIFPTFHMSNDKIL